MESNQFSTTTFTTDESDYFHKSLGSTETVKTAELSESSRDTLDEYKELVDNFTDPQQQQHLRHTSIINATAIDTNLNSTVVQSSLPSHIAKDPGIWYPECRDCPCCHGFKYGCVCISSNMGVCRCVSDALGVPNEISTVSIGRHKVCHQQSMFQRNSTELTSPKMTRRRGSGSSAYRNKQSKGPCRFFFSASGCRHGDACPFDHTIGE